MPSPTDHTPLTSYSPSTHPQIAPLLGEGTAPSRLDTSSPISFSFPGPSSSWDQDLSPGTIAVKQLSGTQQVAFRQALDAWSAVANIRFIETTETTNNVGDIRVAFFDDPSLRQMGLMAYSGSPQPFPGGGDIHIDSNYATQDFSPKTGNFMVLMHELGHALGLWHPFSGPVKLATEYDNNQYTIMSYTPYDGGLWPTTPMVFDIRAVQYMYGPNTSWHTGNDVYEFGPSTVEMKSIWDAGGNDTIDASRFTSSVNIYLTEGSYSSIGARNNIGIAFGAAIEHAIGGSEADVILGNERDNRLEGGAGNDMLSGASGKNNLTGGTGLDTAVFAGKRSAYSIEKGTGSYTVSGSTSTDTVIEVERLRFADACIALDIEGNGGQAYRLYQAAFNRAPDASGLGYQINALDCGLSLTDVAQNFINSPEFLRTYGKFANPQFVTQLYENVLHRAPDAGGLAYHVANLEAGMSRAQTLAGFSESPENKAALIAVMEKGMEFIPVA